MASSGNGPGRLNNPKNRTRLETQVHLFKTPTANLGRGMGGQPPSKRKAGGQGPTLNDEVSFMSGEWLSEDGKDYGPAVRRWGKIINRSAPSPVERGERTARRLSRHFTEWLMGLPSGWVTDVPGLTRGDMLTVLGNGVVPQQAEAAFRELMTDWPEPE